jgi:transposase
MSTSLLYHAFKVRDYSYVRTKYIAGGIVITAERKPQTYLCAACGSQDVGRQGSVTRTFRTLPIGNQSVELEARIPRLACRDCGVIRQAAIGFAQPRRTYTKAFARYVLDLSRNMTIKAVAQHLGVGWDLVKEIQKKDLRKRFDKPRLKHVKQIAIDEISTGKGHQYVTIVMDLESGAVLHVEKGKGGDALLPLQEATSRRARQDRGRGHRHVAGLHRRRGRAFVPCDVGF